MIGARRNLLNTPVEDVLDAWGIVRLWDIAEEVGRGTPLLVVEPEPAHE